MRNPLVGAPPGVPTVGREGVADAEDDGSGVQLAIIDAAIYVRQQGAPP